MVLAMCDAPRHPGKSAVITLSRLPCYKDNILTCPLSLTLYVFTLIFFERR